MTAKEFLFSKYPLVSPEWFDDNKLTQEMIRMMEGYAEKVIEERMPTEEEIEKQFSDSLYNTIHPARYRKEGALWFRSRMKGEKPNNKITCQCPPELQEWNRDKGCYYCTNCGKNI